MHIVSNIVPVPAVFAFSSPANHKDFAKNALYKYKKHLATIAVNKPLTAKVITGLLVFQGIPTKEADDIEINIANLAVLSERYDNEPIGHQVLKGLSRH
jgi:hypothetical protein